MKILDKFLPKRFSDYVSKGIVLALTLAYVKNYFEQQFTPNGDFANYQKFVETLAHGKMDLSIPGFHGSDFLVLPYYLLSHSPTATMQFYGFVAIFLPLLGYLVGRQLYGEWAGVLLALAVAAMPFITFSYLFGYTHTAFMALILLSMLLCNTRFGWIAWGISMITKPFSVCLIPFFIARKMQWKFILLGLAIPALYVLAQYLQTGHVSVGVHEGMDATNFFAGFGQVWTNIQFTAHGIFSVHDYKAWNPGGTGLDYMLHTSPILVTLGFLSIKERYGIPLILSAVAGLLLATIIPLLDYYYLDAGVLLLVIASVPVIQRYPLFLPLVFLTLKFQFSYFERMSDMSMTTPVTDSMYNIFHIYEFLLVAWLAYYLYENKFFIREITESMKILDE